MSVSRFSYPIQLDLYKKNCVIVGGGKVAERKTLSLLAAGATVTVIADTLTSPLEQLQGEGRIKWQPRYYASGDLIGAFLVIVATDNHLVNQEVTRDANALNVLVNVTDEPTTGNFTVPGSYHAGQLIFTVATGGNPVLTKLILAELQEQYPASWHQFAAFLTEAREEFKSIAPTPAARTKFWRENLTVEVLELVRQGREEEAKERIRYAINSFGA